MNLQPDYKDIVMKYINEFSEKHSVTFDYFVGDKMGEVCVFSNYFIDFNDLRLDLDNNIPEETFFKWYDETLIRATNNKQVLNYETFSKGFTYLHLDKGV